MFHSLHHREHTVRVGSQFLHALTHTEIEKYSISAYNMMRHIVNLA